MSNRLDRAQFRRILERGVSKFSLKKITVIFWEISDEFWGSHLIIGWYVLRYDTLGENFIVCCAAGWMVRACAIIIRNI